MKHKFTLLVLINLLFTVNHQIHAGKRIKYGQIDKGTLEMHVYENDTSAEAVVLYDYGYFRAKDATFTRHLRIKILKKEGYKYVNRIFRLRHKASVKGRTYNLVNNEIVTDRLSSKSVFIERLTHNFNMVRLTMPNVKVGSVVDIYFTQTGLPMRWYFQQEIPVCWSELIIEKNKFFIFRKVFYGFEPLHINTDIRWVGKDMPAFRKEPFMNSIENYITKMEIEVAEFTIPGVRHVDKYKSFATSWDAVNDFLINNDYFGFRLQGNLFLNKIVKNLSAINTSEEEKIMKAYEYIRTNMRWNYKVTIYAFDDLNFCHKMGVGNVAEINLMLIALLQKLNIEAYPVILSTRKNGIINPVFPTVNKFNYVIACVWCKGERIFLDATDPFIPAGELPKRCLNGGGRIVDECKHGWIDINVKNHDKEVIYANLALNETGELQGTLDYTKYGYCAHKFRKLCAQTNNQEEMKLRFQNSNVGMKVNHYEFVNISLLSLPLKEKYSVSIFNEAEIAGDIIFLAPMLHEKTDSNPFKSMEREYPVDFACPMEKKYILNMDIPEGYQVVQIPDPFYLTLPEKAGHYRYNIQVAKNKVQFICDFKINKPVFSEKEYLAIKEFYNQMVAKEAEKIVLKRI